MIRVEMDILKVTGGISTSIIVAFSLSDAKEWLAIISISLGILYTIWKFRNDVKKKGK